jgi:hypothetical protein
MAGRAQGGFPGETHAVVFRGGNGMKPRRWVLGLLAVFIVSLAWLDGQSGRPAFAYRVQVTEPTGQKADPRRRIDEKKEGPRRPVDEPKGEGQPKKGQAQRTGAPGPTEEVRELQKPAIEPIDFPAIFGIGFPIIFDDEVRELKRTIDISRVASEMSRINCSRFPGSA